MRARSCSGERLQCGICVVLLALFAPQFPKAGPKGELQPIPLEMMMLVYLGQNSHVLSDPMAEETLSRGDAEADLGHNRIPDEATILNFRHPLGLDTLAPPYDSRRDEDSERYVSHPATTSARSRYQNRIHSSSTQFTSCRNRTPNQRFIPAKTRVFADAISSARYAT
jgi:hypothetical protein